VWLLDYKWGFIAAAFVFLGLAFYKTYRDRKSTGPWSMGMLFCTTFVSIGLIAYTFLK
jgi:hypothetical protein